MYVCAAPDSLPSACQEAAIAVYLCVCVCMCVGMHMHVYMGMDMHITMCKACVRASVCIYLCVRVYASAWACVRERAERAYACVCVRALSTGTFFYSHPRWLRLLCMADVCVMGWTIGGATTWAAYSSPTRLASITRMTSTTCASRCHEIAIRLCVENAGRWHVDSNENMGRCSVPYFGG